MKRLPPAKRNQLIMVVLATILLIGFVIFIFILPQQDKNLQLARSKTEELGRLQKIKSDILQMDVTSATLAELTQQLSTTEEDVISGDVYAWSYDTIRRFNQATYRVDIPTVSQPTPASDVELFPGFPYKQVKLTLNGTAFYHDLGKFIADFENKFPHMRVANLLAEPANAPGGVAERLNFRMEIIALTKPTP